MSENMPVNAKDVGPAFALWLLLGWCGAHRFYLNRVGTGAAMLAVSWVSILLILLFVFTAWTGIGLVFGAGFFTLFAWFVWWVFDAFQVSKWVAEHNAPARS